MGDVELVDRSVQRSRSRALWVETGLVILAILLVPRIFQLLSAVTYPAGFLVGFSDLTGNLAGNAGTTDVGWEVASSRGLIDPSISAYAPLNDIATLIGMSADDGQSNSHPPTALPLGLPLAFVPYDWWLPSWIVAMVCAMAISMRIMGSPPWVAYPAAGLLALTGAGQNAVTGTYPVMAVALAVAWRFQGKAVVSGLAYTVLAASRGVGVVLLLYPLVRRRWRTVLVAAMALVVLGAIAVALEPTVLAGFLDGGRASVEINLARTPLTPMALMGAAGLPGWLAWLVCPAIAAVALIRRRSLFWVTAWLSFALTPIAWPQTFAVVLPLAVMIWRSGRLGMTLMLLAAVPLATDNTHTIVVWPLFLCLSAVALFTCHLDDEPAVDDRSVTDQQAQAVASAT